MQATYKKVSGPLKWHGGKSYLADWIISLMPPRCQNPNAPKPDDPGWLHYVEPFFGGGAVLFANDPNGISEVVNDVNYRLSNFWSVLRSGEDWWKLRDLLLSTPFSADQFDGVRQAAHDLAEGVIPDLWADSVTEAWWFFIQCRQSMSGRMKNFAPLTRNRTRSGMNEQASAWLNAVEGLPAVHERLKRVVILNDDALKVIKQQDGPRTLFYLDPPYLHETRATTGEYDHEMNWDDHNVLCSTLASIKGRFLLSGYPNDLYDEWADISGWNRYGREIDNKSSSKREKEIKTECVWTNY